MDFMQALTAVHILHQAAPLLDIDAVRGNAERLGLMPGHRQAAGGGLLSDAVRAAVGGDAKPAPADPRADLDGAGVAGLEEQLASPFHRHVTAEKRICHRVIQLRLIDFFSALDQENDWVLCIYRRHAEHAPDALKATDVVSGGMGATACGGSFNRADRQ